MSADELFQNSVTDLQPEQHQLYYDSTQERKLLAQASRVGDVYFITGPRYSDSSPILLANFLGMVAKEDGLTALEAVSQLNQALASRGALPEAQVFECRSLSDAQQTLAGLFAAYR